MDQSDNLGPEAAKALVREYFHRLLNEKDLSVCDDLLSSDYVDHDAPADTLPGPQSIKDFVREFLEEYPDMRVDIEEIIAEGRKVAARIVWHGNHRVSRETFHQQGIVILRLDDKGQLTERWSAYRTLR
jgi:predicted SnoaL-like aldol condensation-catalyzing enzyme